METEIWPNLFRGVRTPGRSLVLASARLSANSVARYRGFGGLFRGIFSASSLIAAQTAEDAERFVAIGAQSARTRWSAISSSMEPGAGVLERDGELRSAHSGRSRDRCGLRAARMREKRSRCWRLTQTERVQRNALLLLVPRHPDRFEAVAIC
jgi:3-deoxy-D-manno-octulosonic-acid transferase